jgi:hypothetical protein
MSLVIDGDPVDVHRECLCDDLPDRLLSLPSRIFVWDVRRIMDWPLSDEKVVFEVKSLYRGDRDLTSEARDAVRHLPDPILERFIEADANIQAHLRALKIAGIRIPIKEAIPRRSLVTWRCARALAVWSLASRTADLDGYEARWPFVRALREMEFNGIEVDLPFIERALNGNVDVATGRALRSLQGLGAGGRVTTLVTPVGGSTGRVRHEGGFNSLAIPRGPAREAIISRYENGQIYTLDFNAIDYRCIVRAIGGEIARLYEGAQDFHERTASFIFVQITPELRGAVKYLSYIYIYGGSDETLQARTGWTMEQVRSATALLDRKIRPIQEFRARLWMEATQAGYVDIPGGRRVPVGPDDSPGKVIGLYAQSYSSWVFERAVVRAQALLRTMKSRLIFVVHDEMVIDVHPDDVSRMDEIRMAAEQDGYVVKVKKGTNYGQQA